jgi:hypothetical protein
MAARRGTEPDTSSPAPQEPSRTAAVERREVAVARGGVSPGGILTGVVVAFGALTLLSALVGGAFASSGVDPETLGSTREVGVGVGVGLVVAWFLSCLWGGYTAGRMGRGAGVLNGVLVPIVVLILGLLVAVVVAAFGASANLNLPFRPAQFPTDNSTIYELSTGFGIAILVAMVLGGALGGALGARWHTRLERDALAQEEARAEEEAARAREAEESRRQRSDEEPVRRPAADPPPPESGATSRER